MHWNEWHRHWKYSNEPINIAFDIFMAYGSPIASVVWCWIIFACVLHVDVFAQTSARLGIPALLRSSLLARLAELSYWAYLLHPLIFNYASASVELLYPPSVFDNKPFAALTTSGPEDGSMSGLRSLWFQQRDHWWPHGHALTTSGFLLYGCLMIVTVYVCCFVLMHLYEMPVRRRLFNVFTEHKLLRQVGTLFFWVYIVLLLAVGSIMQIFTKWRMLTAVTPEVVDKLMQDLAVAAAATTVNATLGGQSVSFGSPES
jgi:peptidoglycan/LPS O-acetylase OafA/YrhL